MLMTKRLISFLLGCMSAVVVFGQSLDATIKPAQAAPQVKEAKADGTHKGRISLPKSSVYAVSPSDLFSWTKANGKFTSKVNKVPPRRIGATECFPNDPYIYTVMNATYQTENEGYEQGQVIGLYLNERSAIYKEMGGKTLPYGDYGSRNGYVRVADKWYVFSANKLCVYDAKTGELVKDAETEVGWAARGASYDYNRNKFYVVNWDGLVEIDAETFESTVLGTLSGGFVTCVACSPDGNIYYVTYAGQLYKYDYATKECSEVLANVKLKDADGNTINWQNQGFAGAFDWTTGLMYFTFVDNNWTDHLVCVDTTGANEPYNAYSFPGREMTMMGIYFPNPAKAAPAPATEISLEDGVLTFTVPTTTVDGSALAGGLKAYITVNGEETAYDVTAGETKSVELDLKGTVAIAIEIGNEAGRSAERRYNTWVSNAPKFYANDPYIYTAMSASYQTENEGYAQGQVFGLYLNEKSSIYKEMNGKLLPSADYGSRMAYVRVGDNWYTFTSDKVTVTDAKTGETVKEVPVSLSWAARGGSYDYTNNKFYMVTWDGLIEIDAETFETTTVVELSGLTGGFVTCVACGPDGYIYYITYDGALHKFDRSTKECSDVLSSVKIKDAEGNTINWQNQGFAATFDWTTGLMYYTFIDNNWTDHLVCVDTTGAKEAYNAYSFPGREMTMMGIYFPNPAKSAPAPASDITFKDGVLTFTVPTTAVDGSALSGALKAFITVNGEETEYDVTAGEVKSIEMEVDGVVAVSIEIGNDAGRSAERRVNTFVGTDIPTHVTDLVLNADDGANFQLTWKAPTTTQNGGPLDDQSLNYTVVRMPDNVVVAEKLKDTSFTEPIPARRDRYYYVVSVYTNNQFGADFASNTVSGGTEYVVPFKEQFFEQIDFDVWTVDDHNADGQTWSFQKPWNAESGYLWLSGNGVTNPETGFVSTYDDDYIISLPMHLQKGNDYRLSFDILNVTMYSETMEVLLGKGKTITGDEKVIMETFNAIDSQPVQLFNVEEDGDYTIIFHVNTKGNSVNICVDNVAVDLYASYDGPGAVTDVTVEAGAMGALNNTLTFKAPTLTYGGETLESISRIEVYRNDEKTAAKTFENPAPGEQLTWVDEEMEAGLVNYRILPFNENGQGKEYLTENWVGLDIPAVVTNVKYHMTEDFKAAASWDAVTAVGAHGGYVNPDDVTYALYRYFPWDFSEHWHAVTPESKELSAVDTDYSGWGQEYVTYLVVASNASGHSDGAEFSIVLGEPYDTPYEEGFAYGFASKDPWTLMANSYDYAWKMTDGSGMAVKPYDGDGGMLRFQYINEESNTQVMTSPRVTLTKAEKNELSFYMYHGYETDPGDLTLIVYTNVDDQGWVKADEVDYNNDTEGWGRYAVQLPQGNNVQFAFGAKAADASAAIYLDKICIAQTIERDAAIAFFGGKKRVEAGEESTLSVIVANYGAEPMKDYKVVVNMDNGLGETGVLDLSEMEDLKEIPANGSETYTLDLEFTRKYPSTYVLLNADVQLEGDEVADNNTRDFKFLMHNSNLPQPENLLGRNDAGKISLEWTKPAKDEMEDAVTDGFDEYESFVIKDFGDWQTYDGDGTPTVYFGGPTIANAFEPKAWQVWAPVEAGFSLETFDVLTPHSGDKYLSCWAASDGYSSTLPQDDWLISSEVLGGTDVSFWYRVPNAGSDAQVFELLYSTTDQSPENFTVLDRDSVYGTTDWVQFLFTLPQDAKYFAVRNCSYGSYTVAFIDDIEYTPLYSSTSKLNLVGYNVYRDDELIATRVADTHYIDRVGAEQDVYEYAVTAVYENGESRYSNIYTSDVNTGVAEVNGEKAVSIYAAPRCIHIAGANGKVTVSTVNGQQVFAASTRANLTVNVAPGVYVVKVGNVVRKVTVK